MRSNIFTDYQIKNWRQYTPTPNCFIEILGKKYIKNSTNNVIGVQISGYISLNKVKPPKKIKISLINQNGGIIQTIQTNVINNGWTVAFNFPNVSVIDAVKLENADPTAVCGGQTVKFVSLPTATYYPPKSNDSSCSIEFESYGYLYKGANITGIEVSGTVRGEKFPAKVKVTIYNHLEEVIQNILINVVGNWWGTKFENIDVKKIGYIKIESADPTLFCNHLEIYGCDLEFGEVKLKYIENKMTGEITGLTLTGFILLNPPKKVKIQLLNKEKNVIFQETTNVKNNECMVSVKIPVDFHYIRVLSGDPNQLCKPLMISEKEISEYYASPEELRGEMEK